jgi:hypothetical protein
MSRKITIEAVNAFLNCQWFHKGNTWVDATHFPDNYEKVGYSAMFLHGNCIATRTQWKNWDIDIMISNAWWFSNTTKERLNGIPWVSIVQKKGIWYLNGNAWDGSWATI